MPDREDCYQILGVASDASLEDIKQAFRKKALDYHPDRVVGVSESVRRLAEEEMKKINRAYEVLKDPHKRRQYDSKWAIPKPVVDRLFIHFTDVEPGEIKRASFIIQNHGGSYKKLRIIYDPNSWVRVVHYESLTDSDELPLRVEIEAKGETWEKNYLEYIKVKLDEEETQVKINLQTKPEPIREKVQSKRTPAARPTPPPSPGFPILGKWIVGAVSIFAVIAIFILMNGNWNTNYVPAPPTIGKTGPAVGALFKKPQPKQILSQDNFNNSGSGWSISTNDEREKTYKSGKYSITVKKPNWQFRSWAPRESFPADFEVKVDARQVAGPTGKYGIIWGKDGDNYYVFTISSDGRYRLQKQVNDVWQTNPVSRTRSLEIKRGTGSNQLKVKVIGNSITLIVNDTVLTTVKGSSFGPGKIGLVGASFDDTGVEVQFDNLMIYDSSL